MKKKNKFKSWLIRVLRNWLSKLEPYHNVVKVEHVSVPLVTVSANFTKTKYEPLTEDYINEILAKQLGKEVFKYANIETCEHFSFDSGTETLYRATVRVAADKRG